MDKVNIQAILDRLALLEGEEYIPQQLGDIQPPPGLGRNIAVSMEAQEASSVETPVNNPICTGGLLKNLALIQEESNIEHCIG